MKMCNNGEFRFFSTRNMFRRINIKQILLVGIKIWTFKKYFELFGPLGIYNECSSFHNAPSISHLNMLFSHYEYIYSRKIMLNQLGIWLYFSLGLNQSSFLLKESILPCLAVILINRFNKDEGRYIKWFGSFSTGLYIFYRNCVSNMQWNLTCQIRKIKATP